MADRPRRTLQPGARPDWSVLGGMLDSLKQATATMDDTQRRMLAVTGTAWSGDRMIKAVVGPRGQLIDLEIDPRALRRPDSKALAATILATVRLAVDDATQRSRDIVAEHVPTDLRQRVFGDSGLGRLIHSHDSDLRTTEDDHG